jgi:histidinol-phosphate phosphatase family protein
MENEKVSEPAPNKPCVFFDRDGIVNQCPGAGYVETKEGFYLQEAFVAALKVAREKGYEAILITNQRGVGRGIMSQASLDEIHGHMEDLLSKQGLAFTDIYFCTDTDASPRRKPSPGMLLEAAEKHHLDLASSWMVGDNESDILAGQRAGCRTVLVGEREVDAKPTYQIPAIDGLPELLNTIL